MAPTSRYLRERDDFVSRASRLVPWITPARLTYLAYWADTETFSEFSGDPKSSLFAKTRFLRLPELQELGLLLRFKPEPPWIEKRIPKRRGSGTRVLYLPNVPLKQLHRFVLRAHLSRLEPDRAAFGFEPGRSRREHASLHCNKHVVVRVDIRRFFPSIAVERVESVLEECGFVSRFKNVVAHLVTYHQRLPQGAPTSPKLADLVARPLDRKVRHLAKDRRWTYSRYADDLSLSCARHVGSGAIGDMIKAVEDLVQSEGFELNHGKTRVMKRHNRQLVAGAVVNNASPTVPRERRRQIRAIIHNCKTNGLVAEARRYKRGLQDQGGHPEVEPGRHPGEVRRSDRQWPYGKQIPFVRSDYFDYLIAHPPEDWPWVYDFWHYLCGLVGEVNSIDPARGRELRYELDQLQLAYPNITVKLDDHEQHVRDFWDRASELVATINLAARSFSGTGRFLDFPPVEPRTKVMVVRSRELFREFVSEVYQHILACAEWENRNLVYKLFEEHEDAGELQDLRFAVELRHHHEHRWDVKPELVEQRARVTSDGWERLCGSSKPQGATEWIQLQRDLCDGILEDLETLLRWVRGQDVD